MSARLLSLDGQKVIALCLERHAVATATMVSHAMADFWAELAASDLSPYKRSAHIEALVELLKSAGGAPASMGAGAANSPTDTDAIRDNPAREADALAAGVASSITIQAKAPGSTQGDARATPTAMFHALPAAGPELGICLDSAASLAQQFAAQATQSPITSESRSLSQLQLQLVRDTGNSMAFLKAIVAVQARLGSPISVTTRTLVNRALLALELLAELTHLAHRAGHDDALENDMLRIGDMVRVGELGRAASELAALSRTLETAKDRDTWIAPDLTCTALLPALLAARDRLASLDREPREAARLFERAVEIGPREDRVRRWQLKIAQKRQLVELGNLPSARINALCQAAQIYAAAGGLVSERDCPLAWAEANLELGSLLLQLGNRGCRPERYLTAALHFKPAIAVFTRERAMDGWARSQIGLAHAARG